MEARPPPHTALGLLGRALAAPHTLMAGVAAAAAIKLQGVAVTGPDDSSWWGTSSWHRNEWNGPGVSALEFVWHADPGAL
eukprot:CAMPEP_0202874246 /NCGR_PEP_ID=MMETSP1391-20130828/25045_1 /ASSEMBLY_ACC=CAM_ASM_000867 /TAXON_ID=1034604 /ORGANISM="Chlamydomonas leiostraca, Strain SAG 11-49" /LENGTH=79 /DNA_ID=CAMNT_0049555645 /DNA_START=140 /DNA_END=376 /DNA_ORIENTATION=-